MHAPNRGANVKNLKQQETCWRRLIVCSLQINQIRLRRQFLVAPYDTPQPFMSSGHSIHLHSTHDRECLEFIYLVFPAIPAVGLVCHVNAHVAFICSN